MKTKFLFFLTWFSLAMFAQTQGTFNISTGFRNSNSTLINPPDSDDTWKVMNPGTSTFVSAKVANTLSGWAVPTASRWISPLLNGSHFPSSSCAAGTYTYRATFDIDACGGIMDGSLVLNQFGGDNLLHSIFFNGNLHTVNASFNTLQTATIPIKAEEFINGQNTIDFVLTNNETYTGLLVNGYVQMNFGSCSCGVNMATACNLGTICSKSINQINNSFSQYANNYNTGTGQSSKDIWYKFQPQQNGAFEISTCGSAIDTYLHLLDENGVEIAYNDDQNTSGWIGTSCYGGLNSLINSYNTGKANTPLRLFAGKTYYVVVEGYSSNQGFMNLQIKTCLPCNTTGDGSTPEKAIDLCVLSCTSTSITRNNGDAIFTNTYGTSSAYGQPSKDVWYTFTVAPGFFGQSWYITTCGSSFDDTYIHLLKADKTHIISNNIVNPLHTQCSSGLGKSSITGHYDNITLSEGTYYIVTEGNGSAQGNIKLNIKSCLSKTTVGIDDDNTGSTELSLQAFPNPFNAATTIRMQGGKTDKATIEITNLNGASVYKKENHPISEEMIMNENFPAGVYFVRVNTNSETKTIKIVKLQ